MEKIDAELIKNYRAMKVERADIAFRINQIQEEIDKYGQQLEIDTVRGGTGGKKRFTVEGINNKEYSRKQTELQAHRLKLARLEEEIKENIGEVERTIDKIENPEKRMIIRLHYMDGLSWKKTAERMGEGYTEDAVRMTAKRCMRKMSVKK